MIGNLEAEPDAAEKAGDHKTAARLRADIWKRQMYIYEIDGEALGSILERAQKNLVGVQSRRPPAPVQRNYLDVSDSIGMDFTGFASGYASSLNPWSEKSQAPVVGIDWAIQYAQKGAIVTGGAALTALGAIYAAPVAASAAFSSYSATVTAAAAMNAQVAAAGAATSAFFVH